MDRSRQRVVEFFVAAGAIRFGTFRLKSGRDSPYFFDAGLLDAGRSLLELGRLYAETIVERIGEGGFDILFGPAYKGIPLAVGASCALHVSFGLDKPYLFDRKVEKDHAERGRFVGRAPTADAGRLVLLDDVFTTGDTKIAMLGALRECFPAARVVAVVIALDRMERSESGANAMAEFTRATGIPVHALITARDVAEFVRPRDRAAGERIERYLQQYGVAGNDVRRACGG